MCDGCASLEKKHSETFQCVFFKWQIHKVPPHTSQDLAKIEPERFIQNRHFSFRDFFFFETEKRENMTRNSVNKFQMFMTKFLACQFT